MNDTLAKPPDSLETAEQIAARLAIPKSMVYRGCREGLIPCIKIGRYTRYDPAEVLRALKDGNDG